MDKGGGAFDELLVGVRADVVWSMKDVSLGQELEAVASRTCNASVVLSKEAVTIDDGLDKGGKQRLFPWQVLYPKFGGAKGIYVDL